MVRIRLFLMGLFLMMFGLPVAEACYLSASEQASKEYYIDQCENLYMGTWEITTAYPSTLLFFACTWPNGSGGYWTTGTHFTPTCPTDPPPPPKNASSPTNVPTTNMCGSLVRADSQVLEESVDLVGTPFGLHYSSARALGRNASLKKWIKIYPLTIDPMHDYRRVDVLVAGRTFITNYGPSLDLEADFTWDGLDAAGQRVKGSAEFVVKFRDTFIPPNQNEQDFVYKERIGTFYAITAGMGGWTITPNHFYDVGAKKLYRGDGAEVSVVSTPGASGTLLIPSSDGTEVYVFDSTGRHLSTKTAVKGTVKYTFSYDGSGRLTTIVDQYSNTTTMT